MRYLIFLLVIFSSHALSKPSLNDFVLDPTISDMELSPNGELIAFTKRVEDKRALILMTIAGEVVTAFDVGKDKLRGYEFADDEHLIMHKSLTTRFPGYVGEYEFYGAISINFRTNKSKQLLARNKNLLHPQLELNNILGPAAKKGHVLMAARSGTNQDNWSYDIFRVNLDSGKAKRIQIGKQKTIDWFIDDKEVVHAREDFDNKKDQHQVMIRKDKKWKPIFSNEVEIIEHAFVGLSADNQSLVLIDESPDGNFDALYHFSLTDGLMSKPVLFQEGKEIDATIQGWNGQVLGVRYAGFKPSYQFYDEKITAEIGEVVAQLENSSVGILEFSRDLSKVLLLVEGGGISGRYLLYDRIAKKISLIANKRPEIPGEFTSTTQTINIKARDGIDIPTLVTLPSTLSNPQNLPAIMLPHGGPEAHDQIGFDYQVQYFAYLGYVVIQPNFRGSTGFGHAHKLKGRGKWGKEMQTDLSDALKYLVEDGLVDPQRVCIVGSSYGGYAALAGGAFTPDLYRCVVASAPVSDLPRMLKDELRGAGKDHWVVAYWNRVIGDRKEDKEKLKDVSPAYHAENFVAPVLLLHGDDDTVVPFNQSKIMHKKLKKAGKDVTLIKLKNEDHWMSNEGTRVQSMEAISKFVGEHLK